jgi:hypothetical protein
VAPPPLTIRQRIIRDTIEALLRDYGRPARTIEIVSRTGYRPATLKNELKYLQERHIVSRPDGPKSGWALCHEDDIRLVAVRSHAA